MFTSKWLRKISPYEKTANHPTDLQTSSITFGI